MATLKTFFPATGSEADWDAAYRRLEDYLRALHVVNKVHQNQLIMRLVQNAARRHAAEPGQSPVTLVVEEADAALEGWFARILPGRERTEVMGYVALLIADATEKWPHDFLADEIPAEFQRAVQSYDERAGPDLQVSSMVPRPLDIPPLVEGVLIEDKSESKRGAFVMALTAVVALIALLIFSLGGGR